MIAMTSHELSFIEYKALVEQAPILVWRANLTMECDYFNERWLAFTGRTMAQEIGHGWVEGVHAEDLASCLQVYAESFAQRQVFEMEYRLRRADGVYRWLFDRGVPFHDANGTFAGYIGSCIDVTDRVEAQARLKATQEAEVHTLRGLLPLCAWCHKVRDDRGYWSQLESYVAQHSKATFSHGICPECEGRYFAGIRHLGCTRVNGHS